MSGVFGSFTHVRSYASPPAPEPGAGHGPPSEKSCADAPAGKQTSSGLESHDDQKPLIRASPPSPDDRANPSQSDAHKPSPS